MIIRSGLPIKSAKDALGIPAVLKSETGLTFANPVPLSNADERDYSARGAAALASSGRPPSWPTIFLYASR